jgi:hypothetical protein
VLFFVTGASGAGKTACIPALARLLPDFGIHDFGEGDVPSNPDSLWRQETTERWVRTYVGKYQAQSCHAIVSGEAVFGEIRACPSIDQVNAWHACLLDCDDITRVDRLRARATYGPNMRILCWAAWLRVHAVDPAWCPEVVQAESLPEMRWERWTNCRRGDPAWHQEVISTTNLSLEEVASKIAEWIAARLPENHF